MQQQRQSTIRVRDGERGVIYNLVFEGGLSRLTVRQLKTHLEGITRVPAACLQLYYNDDSEGDRRPLRDSDTGAALRLRDGSVLTVAMTATAAASRDERDDYDGDEAGTRGAPPPARRAASARASSRGGSREAHGSRGDAAAYTHEDSESERWQEERHYGALYDTALPPSSHYQSSLQQQQQPPPSQRHGGSHQRGSSRLDETSFPTLHDRSELEEREGEDARRGGLARPSGSAGRDPGFSHPHARGHARHPLSSNGRSSPPRQQHWDPQYREESYYPLQPQRQVSSHSYRHASARADEEMRLPSSEGVAYRYDAGPSRAQHSQPQRPRAGAGSAGLNRSSSEARGRYSGAGSYHPQHQRLQQHSHGRHDRRRAESGHARRAGDPYAPVPGMALAAVPPVEHNALAGPAPAVYGRLSAAQLKELMAEREYVWYMEQQRFHTEREARLRVLHDSQRALSLAAVRLEREQAVMERRRHAEQQTLTELQRAMADEVAYERSLLDGGGGPPSRYRETEDRSEASRVSVSMRPYVQEQFRRTGMSSHALPHPSSQGPYDYEEEIEVDVA